MGLLKTTSMRDTFVFLLLQLLVGISGKYNVKRYIILHFLLSTLFYLVVMYASQAAIETTCRFKMVKSSAAISIKYPMLLYLL